MTLFPTGVVLAYFYQMSVNHPKSGKVYNVDFKGQSVGLEIHSRDFKANLYE